MCIRDRVPGAPCWLMLGSCWLKVASSWLQDGSRSLYVGSSWPQDAKDGLQRPPKYPKTSPKWLQDGFQIGMRQLHALFFHDFKNTGENKSKPVVRVDRLELLGSKRDSLMNGVNNNQSSEDIPF